ncbi:MAG: four-carbon acid sugar kinase family protein [Treponemataceae bacterium]
MEPIICVIADDFTGAGDSAVQFGGVGKPVRLFLKEPPVSLGTWSLAAVVIDTDSRQARADEAYKKVFSVGKTLCAAGANTFFKKIDSTMRGNPADEIAALMDAAGYRIAVVAPSAPRNKRTVSGGICRIAGEPISTTSLSRDPFNPMTESRVSKLMERRFPNTVRELPLELVRSGGESLNDKIRFETSHGARVFVADAETMDDLKIVAGINVPGGLLFAGSSGLAEAIAGNTVSEKPTLPRIPCGKAIFVIGSVTPTSAAQCGHLVKTGKVEEIVVDSGAILANPDEEKRRVLGLVDTAPKSRALLLRTSGLDSAGSVDASDKASGNAISHFLSEVALATAEFRKSRFLFASGGDTAGKTAAAFGAVCIDFVTEILPGLPFGYFRSSVFKRRMYFISKSGGFGDQDALAKILSLVCAERKE